MTVVGLFDLPAPLIAWGDEAMAAVLPPAARVLLWGLLAAFLSMELYRLLSPQRRIAAVREQLGRAQREMARYDGPAEGIWPLISSVLSLATRRLLLVLPATLAAGIPLLVMIFWLDTAYGHRFPAPNEEVAVKISDPGYSGALVRGDEAAPLRALVSRLDGVPVAEVALQKPVPIVHKYRGWNVLLGNPAGYLPDDAPVDSIVLDLPRLEVIGAGPLWLRGWEASFFATLFLAALALKLLRRIE